MIIILVFYLLYFPVSFAQTILDTGYAPILEPIEISKLLALKDAMNNLLSKSGIDVSSKTMIDNRLIRTESLVFSTRKNFKIRKYHCEVQREHMKCMIWGHMTKPKFNKSQVIFRNLSECDEKNSVYSYCYRYKQNEDINNYLASYHFKVYGQFQVEDGCVRKEVYSSSVVIFKTEQDKVKNALKQQIISQINSTSGILKSPKQIFKTLNLGTRLSIKNKNYLTLLGLQVFNFNGFYYIKLPEFFTNVDGKFNR